jgi:Concanavalin A-like lectin/glucanases superfamily/Peptide-N-glycosidase F, C terminal/Secretion system C-terminal sorting domain
MKKLLSLLFALVLPLAALFAQDTVIVQTLTYDSTSRAGVWEFPSDTNSWRKVIMQYSMRCHDALIGNANFVGCWEWDYSCNTIITDSSRLDSTKSTSPSHLISNFSGNQFDLTNAATYSYFDYLQHNVTYGSTISENTFGVLGASPAPQSFPLGTANSVGRSQFLWTATEMSGQGLTAGQVTSIRLNMATLGSQANFMRIKIKPTTATTLDANSPQLTGFTEVYFANTSFPATGWQQFNFYAPYVWNGTDNLIVELSFRNQSPGTNNQVNCYATGANRGLLTNAVDKYIEFSGSEYIDVDPASFSAISNEVTVSFWSFGGANLPANTSIFEGLNPSGARSANVHLPWSDSNIYWDCGGDNAGFDRISKVSNVNDFRGRWTHWAFTKNATTGQMKIWMDGTLFHSGTGKTRPIDIAQFRIGTGLAGNWAFSGKVNEFQVFSAALDSATIRNWMYKDLNAGHPNYASLVAYYKMDEGSGLVVNDASPHAATGLISGAPVWGEVDASALYRNFTVTQQRPQVYFVRGVYTSTNDAQVVVRDSVLNAPNRVVAYTVVNNDLIAIDTNYYYQSGWQYVYDAQTGAVTDSILAAADSTINITTFAHYPKGPARYEIMSLVTPYGNGLDLGINGVMWEFDMTDFVPILNGKKRMSLEYGGQNQEEIDIRFLFIRGTPPRDVIDIQAVWPLASHGMTNIFTDVAYEPRMLRLHPASAGWKLRSTITGHGQNGEFIARWHYLNINGGLQEARWRVWKECADMPVYPQGGTWLYDRAGWCPGVPSDLLEYEIGSQGAAGDTVQIDYGMDVVSNTSASNYLNCTQLVTYGAPNFALDAAITDIKRPSANVRYKRFNPACNQPVVIIRNEGTTKLDSVDIVYNQLGGSTRTYRWRGSLDFLQSTEVTLPVDNPTFWTGTGNVFEAHLIAPNGGADQHADNDSYAVPFNPWDNYTGTSIDFYWRTNNQPAQNVWRLTDETGATVLQSSPFLTANTTYTEVFNLPAGCYTLKFDDAGDDGLYYWATPNNGTGFARMRENNTTRKIFAAEFGRFFKYDFWTDGNLIGSDVERPERILLYPNPSGGQYNLELEGFVGTQIVMEVYSLMGQIVWRETIEGGNVGWQKTVIDLGHCANGNYLLKIWDGHEMKVRDLIKQ